MASSACWRIIPLGEAVTGVGRCAAAARGALAKAGGPKKKTVRQGRERVGGGSGLPPGLWPTGRGEAAQPACVSIDGNIVGRGSEDEIRAFLLKCGIPPGCHSGRAGSA